MDPTTSNKETGKDTNNRERGDDLNINVKSQDGNTICFKLRRTTQLKKMIDTYCGRIGVSGSIYIYIYLYFYIAKLQFS